MEELIKALTILKEYMKDGCKKYPTMCLPDVMYVVGVDLKRLDADTVKELVECGFYPGSESDEDYDWDNFTQEDWENRWPFLSDCFYSSRYGS